MLESRFRLSLGRGEPAKEQRGVHGRQPGFYRTTVGDLEKVRQYLPNYAGKLRSGHAFRALFRQRIRQIETGRGGAPFPIRPGDRRRGIGIPLPNLFGKWCRPNYNSAVATFCHNIANDLPITVNDPKTELELLYIDDLVEEMLSVLEGQPHRCDYDGLTPLLREDGQYCVVPVTHRATLGEIVDLLKSFRSQPETLLLPCIQEGSFSKKLYSTYLTYLPKEKVAFPLKMNVDERGSFTELLKTPDCGQFSVNISRPGVTKGQHWHHSKWEFFIVVSGHGLIQERKIDSNGILEF